MGRGSIEKLWKKTVRGSGVGILLQGAVSVYISLSITKFAISFCIQDTEYSVVFRDIVHFVKYCDSIV